MLPALLFAPLVSASPLARDTAHGFKVSTTSCDASEYQSISTGLDGAVKLADYAQAHLRKSGKDDIFKLWFGADADPSNLLPIFDAIVSGSNQVSFTCQDAEAKCKGNDGPAYIASSDPNHTVVCASYYGSKGPLADLCADGNTIAAQGSESTDGSWTMHRLLHLPAITNGFLTDEVDTAHDAVELAKGADSAKAIHNIHSVQYYALDVYAKEVLAPSNGCLGDTSVQGPEGDD